jgi:hypothetical protein
VADELLENPSTMNPCLTVEVAGGVPHDASRSP